MSKKIKLEIFRYRPDIENKPKYQTYEIPFKNDWVILDGINYIKDTIDGSLSYRWSCRMGVCGSCGMMVNNVPQLTCGVFLKDYYPETVRIRTAPRVSC
jgi:fumarate reductase iron-sulfur subunit